MPEFATIPGGLYELGWRYTDLLPESAVAELEGSGGLAWWLGRFSAARKLELPAFEIATTSIPFRDVAGDPYELEGTDTLEALCALLDEKLAARGWRLPTEDELEAAAGGSLFAWGSEVPDGIPYGKETSFVRHVEPNGRGLFLNSDPYRVEITRHAMKLGDGGTAICGGDPWPLAWLTLAPSFRLVDADIEECFPETLEGARIRPVKR